MMTILVFLAVLSVLVLAHEWGHFISAVKSGIKVEEFGIGFPPRLFGVYKKNGKWRVVWGTKEIADADGTVYSINLIPLGGFNKIKGENGGVDWRRMKIWLEEEVQPELAKDSNSKESKKIDSALDLQANEIELLAAEFDMKHYKELALAAKYAYILSFVKKQISEDKDAFYTQGAFTKFLVLFSGPAMNFALAIVLLAAGFMIGLPEVVDDSVVDTNARVQVYEVFPDDPADLAGIELGDFLISINGETIETVEEASSLVQTLGEQEVEFVVEREKEILTLSVVPESIDTGEVQYVGVGVSLVRVSVVKYPWWESIWLGIKHTFLSIWLMLTTLAAMIKSLFTTGSAGVALAGPVGIANLTGKFARMGINYLLQFGAMFSINLGIINLLPFPALDGGRIIFVLWEKIKGRPVNSAVETWSHLIGFSLLILMIVVVTYKEVLQMIKG